MTDGCIDEEFSKLIKKSIVRLDCRLAYIPGHILEVLNEGLNGGVASDSLMRKQGCEGGKKGDWRAYLN